MKLLFRIAKVGCRIYRSLTDLHSRSFSVMGKRGYRRVSANMLALCGRSPGVKAGSARSVTDLHFVQQGRGAIAALSLLWGKRGYRRVSVRAVLSCLLVCAAAVAADGPRLVFTKSFPGSVPAYVEISVAKTGDAIYKEDPKDEKPMLFKMSEADASAMFALADKLNHFAAPLESGLKVAFMGKKTFRWEEDGGGHEASFNYSEDLEAKTLLDWFERISETERDLIDLERSVRFDKLGVQDSILRIEVTRDQKRLVAEEQFLPLLDRVVKNESYLHMARTRAAALTESIRGPK